MLAEGRGDKLEAQVPGSALEGALPIESHFACTFFGPPEAQV